MRIYPYFFGYVDNEWEDVETLPDSSFIMTGSISFYGLLLVKTDWNGDSLWSRLYTFPWGASPGYALDVDTDSTFVTTGWSHAFAMRHDTDGDSMWIKTYSSEEQSGLLSVDVVPNEGNLLAGFLDYPPMSREGFIVRTNDDGDTIWTRIIHGTALDDSFGGCQKTDDGGFILCGGMNDDFFGPAFSRIWLVKTDSLGNVENVPPTITNTTIWHDTSFTGPFVVSATITDNQILDTTRLVLGYDPQYDPMLPPDSIVEDTHYFTIPAVTDTTEITYRVAAWDISLNRALDSLHSFLVEPTDVPWSSSLPTTFSLHPPAPNPFNASTRISFSLPEPAHVRLEVFDLLGRRIAVLKDEQMQAGEHAVVWDASGIASGVYFVSLRNSANTAVEKIVLLK